MNFIELSQFQNVNQWIWFRLVSPSLLNCICVSSIDHKISCPSLCVFGVSQGSVFGPVFFTFFICFYPIILNGLAGHFYPNATHICITITSQESYSTHQKWKKFESCFWKCMSADVFNSMDFGIYAIDEMLDYWILNGDYNMLSYIGTVYFFMLVSHRIIHRQP